MLLMDVSAFLSNIGMWVWLGIIVTAVVLEILTPSDLISIWFAAGALVALVISIFFPEMLWLQIVAFIVVSLVLIFSTRKISKKLQTTGDTKTNIDSIIGKVGKVNIEITPHEVGEVKVEGKLWSAISEGAIEAGSYVEVLGVDGVKLIVKKIDE